MNKILNLEDAKKLAQKIKKENKILVITGGCFDILHIGHIELLNQSKKHGDFLFVLLESDKNVNKLKGKNRPINPQVERAQVLASLWVVDYIVLLNEMKNNQDYDNLILNLMPSIITTTKDDPKSIHNQRQAKLVGGKVLFVNKRIKNKSTSLLAKIISEKFDR